MDWVGKRLGIIELDDWYFTIALLLFLLFH